MNIMITGITGRVGANVARHFLHKGHAVRGLVWPEDRQSAKLRKIGAEVVEGDLARSADVAAAAKDQEIILHIGTAFQAGGPFTPEQYFDTNIRGTFNILEAASDQGNSLRHIIVSSTDATVHKYPKDGISDPLQIDTLPLSATSWYSYSKILTEHLLDRYVRHEDLPGTIFRYGFVFGAGEILTFPQFHLRTFIDQLKSNSDPEAIAVLAAMRADYTDDPHLIVACDHNGRPWKKHTIEVREIVHAYDRAVGNPNTFGKIYQLGSSQPFTWDTVIPYLAEQIGAPYSTLDLPITPTYYEHDLSSAGRDFGYDPPFNFQQMVDDAVSFTRDKISDIIATKF